MKYQYKTFLFIIIYCCISCSFSNPEIIYSSEENTSLICVSKNEKFGFINEKGQEVIPCNFDYPSHFYDGWAALKKGKNWSYYNARGQIKLDLKKRFTFCGEFQDGAAFVSTEPTKDVLPNRPSFWEGMCDELQYINKKGEILFQVENKWNIDCNSFSRYGFSDGLLKVTKKTSEGTMIGFLDKSGQLKIPFKFRQHGDRKSTFSDGLAVMGMEEHIPNVEKPVVKYGYINKMGDWEIPPTYKKALPFRNGAAVVWENIPNLKNAYKTFLIDKSGKPVFSMDIETKNSMVRDSLLAVYKPKRNESGLEVSGKYGKFRRYAIAKVDGTMVTDFIYAELQAGKTSTDLWLAGLPEKEILGFVDDNGSVVIPYQYPIVWQNFKDGLAIVKLEGKDGRAVININNEIVLPPESDANYQLSGSSGVISDAKMTGGTYYNRNGQVINFDNYEKAGIFQYLSLKEE